MKGIKLLLLAVIFYSSFSHASMEVEYCEYPPIESNRYTLVQCLKNGMSVVERVPLWGAVDANGMEVVPLGAYYIESFSEGIGAVYDFKSKKKAFVNKKGEFISDYIFDEASEFSEGLGIVYQGPEPIDYDYSKGEYKFINSHGELTPSLTYQKINLRGFKQGFVAAKLDGKWGMIDKNNSIHISFIYENLDHYDSDRVAAKLNEKFGYLDLEGKVAIPFIYDRAGSFQDGVAIVERNNKYGLIDTSGEQITDFVYDEIEKFFEGVARVKLDGRYGFIDAKGKQIIPIEYEDAGRSLEGLVGVKKNDKWGSVNHKGELITPFKYDNPFMFYSGVATVSIDKDYFYIDRIGKRLN